MRGVSLPGRPEIRDEAVALYGREGIYRGGAKRIKRVPRRVRPNSEVKPSSMLRDL